MMRLGGILRLARAAVVLAFVLGCGGGGNSAPGGNLPPTAFAGADQTVTTGASVTLSAAGSTDQDGSVVAFSWLQTAGTTVDLSDRTREDPTFVAPAIPFAEEVLTFRVTVTDDDGATASATTRVTVRGAAAGARAKYVILLIGDGMQLAHEVAGSRYLHGDDQSLAWHGFEYQSVCTTWDTDTYDRYAWASGRSPFDPDQFDPAVGYDPSAGGDWTYDGFWNPPSDGYFLDDLEKWGGGGASDPATDSASAATALATGHKTDSGNISWKTGDPADGSLRTLGETLRETTGGAFGIVSTVQFSHATPACFASHNVNRNNYGEIGHEIASLVRPDVVIGAGHPAWTGTPASPDYGYLPQQDYDGLAAGTGVYGEFVFVEREVGVNGDAAIAAAATRAVSAGRKLFGLFGGSGGHFEIPVPRDDPGNPGFDFDSVRSENPTLAAATTAALRVLEARADGNGFFLMVEGGDIDWANHANSYSYLIGALQQFDRAVQAAIDYVSSASNDLTWENTLVIVTADHGNSHMRFDPTTTLGAGDLPTQTSGGGGWIYPDGEVTYATDGHTNEPVRVYAEGVGTDLFLSYEGQWYPDTRLIDNTQIFHVMARALGLE